jgi:SAM-dependent methyltransferase
MADDFDRRLAFDRDPISYDRGRPSYPDAAFDDLFAFARSAAPTTALAVLEVGPGTGQATTALLARHATVTAVELGPNLAEVLREKLGSNADLRVVTGAFEDVELAERAFDLVFAATAWKWLDPDVRLDKIATLLRPDGVLATMSTLQIRSPVDGGFFERTFPIYRKYRPDEQWTELPTEAVATPPEYDELRADARFVDVQLRGYRWDQTYSGEKYELLLRSYSDMQAMGDVARDGLIRDLVHVIDTEFDGVVTRPLVIALTMGRSTER